MQGTAAGLQDGAAAGLRLAGTSLHCAGLSPLPASSSTDERPRGILKNTSSILVQRVPCGEKKKSQHRDEMNILATYHPLVKDNGLMKVDEPSTPYHRLEDSDEDLRAGTSQAVSPEALAERLASLDSFCPKVLQFGDNKNTGCEDKLTSKKMQKDFEWHRKARYDEGKYLKAQKLAAQDGEEEPPGTSGLTWVIEKPLTSQGVHLLGLAGQAPNGEQKATEKPLTITITQSQAGTALTQKHSGSPVMSSWCHWLVTKELSWKRPEIPDKDAGESQGAPGGPERRRES
uniref:Protein phosphatase inhibitor 2 n=1 Tax=Vombatus ursinus TaxID=29139 RepID=A0A4X2JV90_VOMUR